MRRSTILPVAVVVAILFLTLVAVMSGRSNEPGVAGDRNYPHYVCTCERYCEGDTCTREQQSFVAYLEHADLEPRLESARQSQGDADQHTRSTRVRNCWR